jgi:hypothetical protein
MATQAVEEDKVWSSRIGGTMQRFECGHASVAIRDGPASAASAELFVR